MAFNRSEATSSSGFYEILFISFLFYSVNCISYMCEGLYRERERERESAGGSQNEMVYMYLIKHSEISLSIYTPVHFSHPHRHRCPHTSTACPL